MLVVLSFLVFRPLVFLGAGLILAAIPGGMFWDNEAKLGRLVFGGLMGLVYFCGFGLFGIAATTGKSGETAGSMITVALFAAFGSTWLAMVSALRRGRANG
ncbi:hypothetical protein [Roseibacillus persicicus]|uniref:hypothetical protein n=1 Tax=Roseibacillus persicicus TaxID=454148 RepID=UPI00281271AC|nr:hypothetical protein [Roseibacillus persicicus]